MSRRHLILALAVATTAAISGCLGSATAHPLVPAARVGSPKPAAVAATAYARMTAAQRIGQLFMTGVPSHGATRRTLSALAATHVGNVILDGNDAAGRAAVRSVTASLRPSVTDAGVAPYISTDQEGGEVQRLRGPGFAAIPTALAQGALAVSTLRARSATWGSQLANAGVNLDLAPVADTVPAKVGRRNAPIGRYDREFGHTPSVVATHVSAFIRGMRAAGIDTSVKHFPGLGRASGNTDTSRHVTDPTTRHDPYLAPYAAGVRAGTQFVMVSSARYPKIDTHHLACFSRTVIHSMLRGDLRFRGVVISDDLDAAALDGFSRATRALDFFRAGGTMLLDTSPAALPAMVTAVRARAAAHPAFASTIAADVMTVLRAKASAQLIRS